MITIHDVAKLAGVSIGTVSNVINKSRSVAPSTAQRVLDAIEQLNYIPNTVAKSLKTSQSRIIGILAEDVSAFFTGDIIDGICKFCEEHDYTVNLCNLRVNDKVQHGKSYPYDDLEHSEAFKQSIKTALNHFTTARVEGIIYVGVHPRDVGNILPTLSIPVVYAYSYTKKNDYCVNYDDYQGAHLAVEYMIKQGHSRIALICGAINSVASHKRLMGYHNALMEHDLAYYPEYVCSGNWLYQDGYQRCENLLRLPNPPTAIFAMSDLMAVGAMHAALDHGLSIPDDLSIHGFDNLNMSWLTRPMLSTVHLPLREIGQKAAETMIQVLNDTPPEMTGILIPCSHVERNSIKTV